MFRGRGPPTCDHSYPDVSLRIYVYGHECVSAYVYVYVYDESLLGHITHDFHWALVYSSNVCRV